MQLDNIPPDSWEDRALLFLAYLVDRGMQSSSVKSYMSAIKYILTNDGYAWQDNVIMMKSITRACRIMNDMVHIRLPIQCEFLEIILFEIKRTLSGQPYLQILYLALFLLRYYGLFRTGELCNSAHVIKACNVHAATNKEKILVILLHF